MNYFKERSKLIELQYQKGQNPINIYKQIIEKKFIKRPLDFFEGKQFFQESKQIQQALEIELNSLIIDISVLELKNMAQKFRDIYKLLTIILDHVTQRAIYFYTKFKKQRQKNTQTNNKYCKNCANSLTLQRLKWQNKTITQVSLGTLKSITKHQIEDEQQQMHLQSKKVIQSKQKYINTLKASNAVDELNKIILKVQSKNNLMNSSFNGQHKNINQNLKQQRKRVTGLVQNKKQIRWSIPKIIQNKQQKQDKMVGTTSWQYQHIQQTLTIQKQAAIRTLSLQRQRSQSYITNLRKSKRIIEQQKEQIIKLSEQIQCLLDCKNKYQSIISNYKKEIDQLNQRYLDLNKIFQKTQYSQMTNKKQLIGQIINFDILKNQYEQFKRRPRVNQQTQTKPKVILNKSITSRSVNKNILNKSTIHRPKSTNINQSFSDTKVKTMKLVSNVKSHSIINSPFTSIQNTPKQSFFLEESRQTQTKIQQQVNDQIVNNFIQNQSQSKTLIMKQQKIPSNKTKQINFRRNRIAKTVSTQNNQNSLPKQSNVIKHFNYLTFKTTQNSLTKTQKELKTKLGSKNNSKQINRSKIFINRTHNTSPFELEKQINSEIKNQQISYKNLTQQPKQFIKPAELSNMKFQQQINKISNQPKKSKQKSNLRQFNQTISDSPSLKKHKLKLNIKSIRTHNQQLTKNVNETLRIIKQKQLVDKVIIFLKQNGCVSASQLSDKHHVKQLINHYNEQCIYIIDYFIKLIQLMFQRNNQSLELFKNTIYQKLNTKNHNLF